MYLFYNFIENPNLDPIWNCCAEKNLVAYGCSFTSLSQVKRLKANLGRKTFNNIHKDYGGQPLKCIVCFGLFQQVANAFGLDPLNIGPEYYNNYFREFPVFYESKSADGDSDGKLEPKYEKPKYRLVIRLDEELGQPRDG